MMNHTSLAAVQHGLVLLQDNEPNMYPIYTLNEAIVASAPVLPQPTPSGMLVGSASNTKGGKSGQQQLEPTNNQYTSVQTDTQLLDFLGQYNTIGEKQVAAALIAQSNAKPTTTTAPVPTRAQNTNLIYNTPPPLMTHNLTPQLNHHRLGLLHKTIFTTENPTLFWLAYLNYYCHIAHHQQQEQYLVATQTPGTRQHFMSYRRAIMLRQLRHRFPVT